MEKVSDGNADIPAEVLKQSVAAAACGFVVTDYQQKDNPVTHRKFRREASKISEGSNVLAIFQIVYVLSLWWHVGIRRSGSNWRIILQRDHVFLELGKRGLGYPCVGK